jgi:hypothetical protein
MQRSTSFVLFVVYKLHSKFMSHQHRRENRRKTVEETFPSLVDDTKMSDRIYPEHGEERQSTANSTEQQILPSLYFFNHERQRVCPESGMGMRPSRVSVYLQNQDIASSKMFTKLTRERASHQVS